MTCNCTQIENCSDWDEILQALANNFAVTADAQICLAVSLGAYRNALNDWAGCIDSADWEVLDDTGATVTAFTVANGATPAGTNVVGGSWLYPTVDVGAFVAPFTVNLTLTACDGSTASASDVFECIDPEPPEAAIVLIQNPDGTVDIDGSNPVIDTPCLSGFDYTMELRCQDTGALLTTYGPQPLPTGGAFANIDPVAVDPNCCIYEFVSIVSDSCGQTSINNPVAVLINPNVVLCDGEPVMCNGECVKHVC